MTRPHKGRQVVYLVTVPPDFVPQRPWDVLSGFSDGELYARNLTSTQGLNFARTHNKKAILDREQGQWDRRWAIVVKHIRSLRDGRHPLAGKGGAL